MFASLFRLLTKPKSVQRSPLARKARPGVENLEARDLMAVDMVGVVHGSNQWLINQDDEPLAEVQFAYGLPGDKPIVGKWTGGSSYPGVFRAGGEFGLAQWALDTDYDAPYEKTFSFGFVTDTPVVGDWDGDGKDNIGVVRPGSDGLLHWYLDWNGDGNPAAEVELKFGLIGDTPVVGDWDGDGKENIGSVRTLPGNPLLQWYMDTNSGLNAQGQVIAEPADEIRREYGLVGDVPVVGDWTRNGGDDIGVVRPQPDTLLHWYLNSHWRTDGNNKAHDEEQIFGLHGDIPVAGDWRFPSIQISGVSDGQTAPVDFGILNVGQPKTAAVHIVNSGAAPLVLQQPIVPAGFRLTNNAWMTPIAPGASLDLLLTVDATSPGIFGGSMVIANNDPDTNPFDFPLRVAVGTPKLTVDGAVSGQTTANFGTISEGASSTQTFTVRNTGTRALSITGQSVTHPWFQIVGGLPSSIAPGASSPITIRFNGVDPGAVAGKLVISANDLYSPANFEILLTGMVSGSDITVTPLGGTFDFGAPLQGATAPTKTFTVRNDGNATLTINSLTLPAGFTIAKAGATTLAPQTSTSFVVALNTATPGTFAGNLTMTTNDFDEAVVNVPLTGKVLQPQEVDVASYPNGSIVQFNTIYTGQSTTGTFTVRNLGDVRLNLGTATADGGWQVSQGLPAYLDPKQSATVKVVFNGVSAGNFAGILTIPSNDADESQYRINLKVTVVAVPDISVIQTSTGASLSNGQTTPIELGAALQGQAGGAATFRIRNDGQAALNLTSLSVPQGFQVSSGGWSGSVTLAPGASRDITIQVTTGKVGTFQGAVVIGTNDPDENPFSFAVRGRVTAPEIDVSVSGKHLVGTSGNVQFGAVYGSGGTQTVTIRNQGDGTMNLNWFIPSGFSIQSPPASIAPNSSVTVSVKINTSIGEKSGTLRITNNDVDEGTIFLNLWGRVFEGFIPVSGSAISISNGTGTLETNSTSVVIEPVNGRVPSNTATIVNGLAYNGSLGRVYMRSGGTAVLWTPNISVTGATTIIYAYKTGLI